MLEKTFSSVFSQLRQQVFTLLAGTIITSLLFSCISQRPIRRLDEIADAFYDRDHHQISRLIEATTIENRDIRAAAIYYLGAYVPVLREKKITKTFTVEIQSNSLQRIRGHLQKSYAINEDFNIRCLCLAGLGNFSDRQIPGLFLEALKDADETVKECAVRGLQVYCRVKENRSQELLEKLLQALKNARPPLAFYLIDVIICFRDNPAAISGLKSFQELTESKATAVYAAALLTGEGTANE